MSDLRLAIRQLLKSPGFTAVAIISLALGIGANTAIFSLVNDALLRSLPVPHPDELILLRNVEGIGGRMSRAGENNGSIDPVTGRPASTSFSLLAFERMQVAHPALSSLFAFAPFSQVNVMVDGQPEIDVSAQLVSGTYYNGLEVSAVIGRVLTAEDDRSGASPVAVISYRYWQRRFTGRFDALGRTILVNRVPTSIVGVSAQGFNGALQAGDSPDISVPLIHHLLFQPNRSGRAQPWYWWIRVMGRLAPGVAPAQAAASLEHVFQDAAREGWIAGRTAATPANEVMPGLPLLAADPGAQGENDARRQYAKPLRVLMTLVALVLAAACANVANLLLARGVARRREIGLRLALGASRGRIVRQLFAESAVLAAAGAALGIALAWWSRGPLLALRPFGNTAVVLDLPLDRRVLGFTVLTAAVTSLLFGLAPALRATRVDLTAQFQSGARTLGGGSARLSQILMVVQIALSLVLLVSTGLFVRTLGNLRQVDAGFDRSGLVLFKVDAVSAGYKPDRIAGLQSRLQAAMERLPGVRAATFSNVALLSRVRQNKRVTVNGCTPPAGTQNTINTNGLAPNFFEAMALPIVLGRGFTDGDDERTTRVAVVNQAFARTFCGDQSPMGRQMIVGSLLTDRVEIVGIAADAKYTELRSAAPPTIYFPARQRIDGEANFAVRVASTAPDAGLYQAIRSAVRAIDPSLPVLNLRTQDEQIDRLNGQERLFARLSGLFGAIAVALAGIGLYGLMSHAVLRRTGEIGLRMALGAQPAQVLGMILRESMALVTLGVAIGAGAAYAAARVVSTMLFGLSPGDPLTYAVVALVLVAIAALAASVPARRASRIDPMTALKIE